METPSSQLASESALNARREGPRFALTTWLLATLALLTTTSACAILVTVVVAIRTALAGERSTEAITQAALDAVESVPFQWVGLVVSELTLLTGVALACRWLRVPARERLGFVPAGLSVAESLALGFATTVPFALGLGFASLVGLALGSADAPPEGLERMWLEGGRTASALWVLSIALLPGFAEEFLYRGLLQRGLLQRWSPAAAILTSSLLFALAHGEPESIAFIVPVGLWFGVVAWRTGSVWPTILMHASMNGLWTAAMMTWHREPASQPVLTACGWVLLALGLVALPFAIRTLRREQSPARVPAREASRSGTWRLAGAAAVAALLAFVFLPAERPQQERTASAPAPSENRAPTLAELEESVVATTNCPALGDAGTIEFELTPGRATRVQLPPNLAGVEDVVVQLDAQACTVWLAYAGERSGKGVHTRPRGIVEQLVSGQPTLLRIELSEGVGPVLARLTLEDDASTRDTRIVRALDAGWAVRSRK